MDVLAAGSTTFKREDLQRGFEPDECFSFGDAAGRVRVMDDVDLDAGDPPPDLVVEADLTSSSLNKLPIYARLRVAEVWRYAGGRPDILGLWRRLREDGVEPLPAASHERRTRTLRR